MQGGVGQHILLDVQGAVLALVVRQYNTHLSAGGRSLTLNTDAGGGACALAASHREASAPYPASCLSRNLCIGLTTCTSASQLVYQMQGGSLTLNTDAGGGA